MVPSIISAISYMYRISFYNREWSKMSLPKYIEVDVQKWLGLKFDDSVLKVVCTSKLNFYHFCNFAIAFKIQDRFKMFFKMPFLEIQIPHVASSSSYLCVPLLHFYLPLKYMHLFWRFFNLLSCGTKKCQFLSSLAR